VSCDGRAKALVPQSLRDSERRHGARAESARRGNAEGARNVNSVQTELHNRGEGQ